MAENKTLRVDRTGMRSTEVESSKPANDTPVLGKDDAGQLVGAVIEDGKIVSNEEKEQERAEQLAAVERAEARNNPQRTKTVEAEVVEPVVEPAPTGNLPSTESASAAPAKTKPKKANLNALAQLSKQSALVKQLSEENKWETELDSNGGFWVMNLTNKNQLVGLPGENPIIVKPSRKVPVDLASMVQDQKVFSGAGAGKMKGIFAIGDLVRLTYEQALAQAEVPGTIEEHKRLYIDPPEPPEIEPDEPDRAKRHVMLDAKTLQERKVERIDGGMSSSTAIAESQSLFESDSEEKAISLFTQLYQRDALGTADLLFITSEADSRNWLELHALANRVATERLDATLRGDEKRALPIRKPKDDVVDPSSAHELAQVNIHTTHKDKGYDLSEMDLGKKPDIVNDNIQDYGTDRPIDTLKVR